MQGSVTRVEEFAARRTAGLSRGLGWLAQNPFERQRALDGIAGIERELGAWLDRLETGDYTGQLTVARCLRQLEQLDFELLMARMLLGRPRPRSARLAAAIERLAGGSVEAHLTLLREGLGQDPLNVAHEAARAGDQAWSRGQAEAARAYYELVLLATPPDGATMIPRPGLRLRLAELAERAGDLSAAREALTRALAELPATAAEVRVVFRRRLAELALAADDLDAAAGHLIAARGAAGGERSRWYATAAALRQRQGRRRVAERLARRAWACAGDDDWAAVRAALMLARLASSPERMRRWVLRAAHRAPDDTEPRELEPLLAMLSRVGLRGCFATT